ncbi:MAG: glutamate--cysteine ligase [Rubrivivax sp.]|jgi:glutamate--cysteine ligase|nr:glutamate--cysteine ligase [Rubrivivax sp.]
MTLTLERRLHALGAERLQGMRRGVEKESLRVLPDAGLALTPHPLALGSALTHPHITTDYSESQLELITGVHPSAAACELELVELHQVVYRAIGDERLWVGSMPCGLPADEGIPLGRYGTSNIGRAKTVYRVGLSHRYGRRMQTISGIHYNWSLPGLSSEEYFALIRNFRRQSFLLLLLFGASPAVCPSFVEGRDHGLQRLSENTLHLPHATSLRMGRLGYQSDAQSKIAVSYNSLQSYASSLHEALTQPHPAYERIGIRNLGGEYNQLATSLLQIENEFYGTIRPKRVIRSGERPLRALRERGVEYVEVRCMDLDPFEPVGIAASTMRVLDVFLLHCLLSDSPPDSPEEIAALSRNQHLAASRGREDGLTLERAGREVRLVDWAAEILEQCGAIAAALDTVQGGSLNRDALSQVRQRLTDAQALPSARVLRAIEQTPNRSYTRFVRQQGEASRTRILELPYPEELAQRASSAAAASLAEQARIEAADELPFETFRQRYVAAETLLV